MRKNLLAALAAISLGACSGAPVADPGTATPSPSNTTPAPTTRDATSAELGAAATVTKTPGAPAAGARNGSVSVDRAINDPPSPGRYLYRQDGYQTFGALRFNFDPEGTLDVDEPEAALDNMRQRTTRRYSSNRERETHSLFRRDAILLEQATERIGSGTTRQTFVCRTPEPVPVLPIPWRVGASWQGGGVCDGLTLDYDATLRKVEMRVVGGMRLRTLVIDATYTITGDDLSQKTSSTIWFSPDHGLVARQVERTTGSVHGTPFERELVEELVSATPSTR